MKRLTIIAAGLAALSLGGCVIVASDDGADVHTAFDFDDEAGSVFGAEVSTQGVAFTVTSNGCTDKSFMDVDVDQYGGDEYEVTVRRTEPDRCRALVPDGVRLEWSYDELGIEPGSDVRIGNRVRRR